MQQLNAVFIRLYALQNWVFIAGVELSPRDSGSHNVHGLGRSDTGGDKKPT